MNYPQLKVCLKDKINLTAFCTNFEKVSQTSMPTDIAQMGAFEAFKYASRLTYPEVPQSWEGITLREAEKIIDGWCSKGTLAKMRDRGYLRANSESKIYDGEMRELAKINEIGKILEQAGLIQRHETIDGKKIFAIVPQNISTLGKSENEQHRKSVRELLSSRVVQRYYGVTLDDEE